MIRFISLLLLISIGHCQEKKIEIGVKLENDSFTSTYYDQYYTNGTEVFVNFSSKPKSREVNRINGFRIGQHIFNPKNVKSDFKEDHDRPFAGYLFVEFSQNKYFEQSVWSTSYQIGILGPAAQADDFQKWMHNTFGFGKIYGWQYQIQNTIGIQYNNRYTQNLGKTHRFNFLWDTNINIGTIYNSLGTGLLTQLKITSTCPSLKESNFFDGLNSQTTAPFYMFIYIIPKLNIHLYDATIQGSLWDNKSEVTYPIIPFRFTLDAGINTKFRNWNFAYEFHYTSRQINNKNTTDFFYGSLKSSFIF